MVRGRKGTSRHTKNIDSMLFMPWRPRGFALELLKQPDVRISLFGKTGDGNRFLSPRPAPPGRGLGRGERSSHETPPKRSASSPRPSPPQVCGGEGEIQPTQKVRCAR